MKPDDDPTLDYAVPSKPDQRGPGCAREAGAFTAVLLLVLVPILTFFAYALYVISSL